jgi:hypothetical protein
MWRVSGPESVVDLAFVGKPSARPGMPKVAIPDFASLQRLDLRLVYTSKRKAPGMKKALDRWPTLPIAVWYPWQCTIQSQGESFILEDENNASFALQYFSTLIAYVKSTSSSQPRCS